MRADADIVHTVMIKKLIAILKNSVNCLLRGMIIVVVLILKAIVKPLKIKDYEVFFSFIINPYHNS